jgi:hypothetical protein
MKLIVAAVLCTAAVIGHRNSSELTAGKCIIGCIATSPETIMASNPRRPFGILSRLRNQSGQFRFEFKEMAFMLTYLVALLGLFWFMNKVADSHITSGVTGSVLK